MEPSVRYALTVALFYGICSASMNFFNKILLNTWSFKFPNFIMFVQLQCIQKMWSGSEILSCFGSPFGLGLSGNFENLYLLAENYSENLKK